MPGGGAVGQTVLDHHPDGELLHAASVEGLGQSQGRQIGSKATAAVATTVTRELDVYFDRATGLEVAQIEETTRVQGVASGALAAARAGTCAVDAATEHQSRRCQVLRSSGPFGGV